MGNERILMYSFWPSGASCLRCVKNEKSLCHKIDCSYFNYMQIVSVLRSAKETLDICVCLFSLEQLVMNVVKLVDMGVKVRLITDGVLTSEAFNAQHCVKKLSNSASVKIISGPGLMHHKFAIIDRKILINGSLNFTKGGFFTNYENLEVTNEPSAVTAFHNEFQILWNKY